MRKRHRFSQINQFIKKKGGSLRVKRLPVSFFNSLFSAFRMCHFLFPKVLLCKNLNQLRPCVPVVSAVCLMPGVGDAVLVKFCLQTCDRKSVFLCSGRLADKTKVKDTCAEHNGWLFQFFDVKLGEIFSDVSAAENTEISELVSALIQHVRRGHAAPSKDLQTHGQPALRIHCSFPPHKE